MTYITGGGSPDGNDITRISNGLNIYTGGTANAPTINISAGTLTSLSATTLSGGTIYSGATDIYKILYNPFSYSTANQVVSTRAMVVLSGSVMNFEAGDLKLGSIITYDLYYTKIASGTTGGTFGFFVDNTAPTTASTLVSQIQMPTGTAAADTGKTQIQIVVRTGGASGILQVSARMGHSLTSTGLSTVPANNYSNTSGTINVTTPVCCFLTYSASTPQQITFTQVQGTSNNL